MAPPRLTFSLIIKTLQADIISGALGQVRSAMLPLFDFAGELETEPFVFEDEIKSNDSLPFEALRTVST